MKIYSVFSNFIRFLVGTIFLLSGTVKLLDPMGLEFKMNEYFSYSVFNMPFLEKYSYYLGLVLIISEILLGLMLILGYKIKLTLYSLFLFTIFFGFLTFYSAYFNKVTDCGCFGDAVKFSPWQSFGKDIILFILILILILNTKPFKSLSEKEALNQSYIFLTFSICIFIARYTFISLPIIDFRPYKIGTNIKNSMTIPENSPKDIYENLWMYKIGDEIKEFKESEEPWNIAGAEFVNRETKLVKKGYEPPIHDFIIQKDNIGLLEDVTDSILNLEKIYIVISYDLSKVEIKGIKEINDWYKNENNSKNIVMITSTTGYELKKLKSLYDIDMPIYGMDNIALKTMIRSNPGIMVLEKGTIIDKKNWRDIKKIK